MTLGFLIFSTASPHAVLWHRIKSYRHSASTPRQKLFAPRAVAKPTRVSITQPLITSKDEPSMIHFLNVPYSLPAYASISGGNLLKRVCIEVSTR